MISERQFKNQNAIIHKVANAIESSLKFVGEII